MAQRQLVTVEEGTDSEWAGLPEELKLKVLDREWTRRDSRAVRGTCRRWRAMHDASRKKLRVHDGVPEEVICSLCGRLPALTILDLGGVKSLTTEGLRAVGGLTTLTELYLGASNVTNVGLRELRGLTALSTLYLSYSNVTDVGLRELRGLTALSTLSLGGSNVTNVGLRELRGLTALSTLRLTNCPSVTDVGLQELTTLTALTQLFVHGCSTSKAGRDALKAAIPGLTIYS
jgi:Leucine-rich repeat (LRR) protein